MDSRSFTSKVTAEDRLTLKTWKWRLAAVYGAVLLMLVLMLVAAPRHTSEITGSRAASGPAAATMAAHRTTP